MSSKYSLKGRISKCKIKGKALIIVEGHTDKKIYDNIINEKVTQDTSKYELRSVKEFSEINSGGCNQILNLLETNKSYLEANPITKDILLAFIDGDAKVIRTEDKFENFKDLIHRLKYYSIESYCFSEKCLEKILNQYLVGTRDEISKFSPLVYENIIKNISKDAFNLAILCILNDKGVIKSRLSYGLSEGIFVEGKRFFNTINEEVERHKDKIEEYVRNNSLECNFEIIKIITKGKHLIYLVSKELSNQIKLLNSKKVCETYAASDVFKEICCTTIDNCDKEKCSFSTEELHGQPFNKDAFVSLLTSLIKNNIDYNECEEIIEPLKRVVNIR